MTPSLLMKGHSSKERFQIFGLLGGELGKRHEDEKAQMWTAIRKLDNTWKSNLPWKLTLNFLRSTVESILLYGAKTWTMTKTMNSENDGTYTRLLRHALNINWRQHVATKNLFRDLHKISSVIHQTIFSLITSMAFEKPGLPAIFLFMLSMSGPLL